MVRNMKQTFINTLQNLIDNEPNENKLKSKKKYEKYISGENYPTINSILQIAKHYDCSLEFLLGLSTNKGNAPQIEIFDNQKFLQNYNKILEQINTSHWKLCREIELDESTLRKWKKGTKPSIETLVKIANALNISICLLIE